MDCSCIDLLYFVASIVVKHDDKGNLHCTYNNYSSHYCFVEVNYVYSR